MYCESGITYRTRGLKLSIANDVAKSLETSMGRAESSRTNERMVKLEQKPGPKDGGGAATAGSSGHAISPSGNVQRGCRRKDTKSPAFCSPGEESARRLCDFEESGAQASSSGEAR